MDQAKQGEQNTQVEQVADVAVRNWLHSFPGTMQEEEGQLDIGQTYQTKTEMYIDDEVEGL